MIIHQKLKFVNVLTSSSESLRSCARRTLMLRNRRFMSTLCLRETLLTRLCCEAKTQNPKLNRQAFVAHIQLQQICLLCVSLLQYFKAGIRLC